MRKVFVFVGVRGYNAKNHGYSEASISRGLGMMQYWIDELARRNEIMLHSVSISTTLLPYEGVDHVGASVHIAATVVYEGELVDPIGAPVAHYLGEPRAYMVEL